MPHGDWVGGRWLEGWEIWIKLACVRFPHHPSPRGECCLGVKVSVEANAATGACSLCSLVLWLGLLPQSASFNTKAGLSLSADTVTGLPHTSKYSVFSLCERTWYWPLYGGSSAQRVAS
jgi:hypothetical protein